MIKRYVQLLAFSYSLYVHRSGRLRPIVIENVKQNPRRSTRAKRFSALVRELAIKLRTRVREVLPADIRQAFTEVGAATKREIATVLASLFPELRPRVPPRRKPWTSETEFMAVFDAVATSQVFYRL